MSLKLEFSDSQVSRVEALAGKLNIHFSAAFVHGAMDAFGSDTGYVQALEIELSEISWSGSTGDCIGKLSEGQLIVDGRVLRQVPVPFEHSGDISLDLTFANMTRLLVPARSVRISFSGETRFVESFAC